MDLGLIIIEKEGHVTSEAVVFTSVRTHFPISKDRILKKKSRPTDPIFLEVRDADRLILLVSPKIDVSFITHFVLVS